MLVATITPLRLNHGPAPMRSRALTVAVLRYARHCLVKAAGSAAIALVRQISSAPARPSVSAAVRRKSPPIGPPVLVMKKLKLVVGGESTVVSLSIGGASIMGCCVGESPAHADNRQANATARWVPMR